ncbi:MAG: hypothetical protein V3V35_01385 [Dehalococcoidia bacterium]
MYWSHFVNLFQPASKSNDYIRKATRKCYLPLVEILDAHPNARMTINLDGSLAERLDSLGLGAVLEGLRRLAERGQVELTASAYGGPVLGTLSPDEMAELIQRNTQVNVSFFGDVYRPRGFFPPEMSYTSPIAPVVRDLGCQWILLDEMSHSGTPGAIRFDRVYAMEEMPELKILFRDRSMSTGIMYGSFQNAESFMEAQRQRLSGGQYVVTGTEADLYGMRRTGPRDFLVDMMEKEPVSMITASEVLDRINTVEPVKPVPASWSTWDTLAF